MSKKVISVCVPYYLPINGFFKIDSLKSLHELLSSSLLSTPIKTADDEKFTLASHILSSHLNGEIYIHNDSAANVNYQLISENLQIVIDN
jgi:hypothetical protein